MKLSRDVQSLSIFKRDTTKFLRQMKRTGEPIILTVNGKAAAVVHDPDGYETYSSEKDYYETLGSIRRGLADARAGRLTEAEEFFKDFEEKHGIPHD